MKKLSIYILITIGLFLAILLFIESTAIACNSGTSVITLNIDPNDPNQIPDAESIYSTAEAIYLENDPYDPNQIPDAESIL